MALYNKSEKEKKEKREREKKEAFLQGRGSHVSHSTPFTNTITNAEWTVSVTKSLLQLPSLGNFSCNTGTSAVVLFNYGKL